jgi:hypothetical protein
MDKILKKLKRKSNDANTSLNLLCAFNENLLKTLPQNKGKGPDFSRLPGNGTRGELRFRNKLFWLRTIPLENNSTFIALHSETGGYYSEKKGKYSADLLGICHKSNPATTQFALAELKAGKSGDPIFYAVAEGLRNIYLHWQGIERLSCIWSKWSKKSIKNAEIRGSVWGSGNPFNRLDMKNICLLIIGDHSWAEAQRDRVKYVPIEIKLNGINVEISVYSLAARGKDRSNPYMLLPLKRYR